jgi:hypothetical protein
MRPTTQGARARSVHSNTHHRGDMVDSTFFGREGSFGGDQVWREPKISRANILVGTTVTMPHYACDLLRDTTSLWRLRCSAARCTAIGLQ